MGAQERVKTIMTRMARTANLEAKMETLKAAMGEEYETALDDDQDDIDTVLQVPHTGTAELITPQMIQQYEQQVTKLTWVKQKIQALQVIVMLYVIGMLDMINMHLYT